MKKELIIFGVGGILLKDGVNPLVDILGLLGKQSAALGVQEEYDRRKEKGPWGLAQYADLYRGTKLDQLMSIATEYLSEQLRPNVQKTIRTLKERGYVVGAMSAHPDFVMDAIKDMLDLDFSEGTKFEYSDGVMTGNLARELNRNTKCKVLEEITRRFGVENEHATIVANSITQVPVIEKVGRYIAFNQSRDLGHKPNFEVRDGDFAKLLEVFR